MAIYSSKRKLKSLHKKIMFSFNIESLLKLQNNKPNFPAVRNIFKVENK